MPKKIFELAKELEKGPLDLVEELKGHGFAVRNHMTSLTDEEVVRAMSLLAPKDDASAKPKKKKVTKKKKASASKKKASVTKKKVLKKSSTTEVIDEKVVEPIEAVSVEEVTEEEKAAAKKKKGVIRKKSGDSSEESSQSESLSMSSLLTDSEQAPSGLRIVAEAERKIEDVPVADSTSEPVDEDSHVYKEKVHRFTPVFIPEKKKEEPVEKKKEASSSTTATTAGSTNTGRPVPGAVAQDSTDKDGATKKRLGGLASMMSGKKAGITRSQVLVQDRADTEMKSYAALSGTGRPIYTQVKRKRSFSGPVQSTSITDVKDSKRVVRVHHTIKAVDFSKKLKVKLKELVDKCLDLNLLVKGEDYLGLHLASEIASLYDYRVVNAAFDEEKVMGIESLTDDQKSSLPSRNPIITIMGHVDHGKTTLLDYIRNEKVAAGEAGGITQHIGAYSVEKNGKTLTFLDTPGHAAFASMRQRGADITDVVILVVAADDGVMPQTKESVRFCKQANKTLIVAVNKCDKENVNPDKVKQELTEVGVTPEEWGGDTMFVHISALNGDGVDELLESIAVQSEMMELRADPKGISEGIVIESKIEPGRGPVATVLIQSGTLKKGDSIVVGETYGRARSLTDCTGKQVQKAGPSTPIQILGLDEAPSPGDSLNAVKNEREAKKIVQNRINERKELAAAPTAKKALSLEDFFGTSAGTENEVKDLNVVVRTDVQGSFEAIKQSLESLSTNEVNVRVIAGGAGPINDNDVQMASNSGGFIFGFNMRPVTSARRLSEEKGIEIRTYSIIYELINDVKLAIEGLLEPEFIEKYIGRAEVKDTFSVPRIGVIAGSVVIDGSIQVGCQVRLLRNGKIVFDGKMSSLKRFKDDVKEVKNGYECGVGLEGYNDVKVGDLFEAYTMDEIKRTYDDVVKNEAIAAEAAEKAAALAAENAAMEEQPTV